MLIRALIVLLLILNLGVAAWWVSRPSPESTSAAGDQAADESGVPRLRLADEQIAVASAPTANAAVAAPAAPAAAAPDAATPPGSPDYCVSFGPYASADEADQAQQRVQPVGGRARTRAEAERPSRGWKVWLPPHASLEEVEAVAARVAAGGFNDQFIVREGPEANSLALGRFASQVPAQQHADRLIAAGFPARVEPIGTGPVNHWLDVAASRADAARLRSLAEAPEARDLDCATWQ